MRSFRGRYTCWVIHQAYFSTKVAIRFYLNLDPIFRNMDFNRNVIYVSKLRTVWREPSYNYDKSRSQLIINEKKMWMEVLWWCYRRKEQKTSTLFLFALGWSPLWVSLIIYVCTQRKRQVRVQNERRKVEYSLINKYT